MKKLLAFFSLLLICHYVFSQKVENVDFNLIDNKIVIYYDLLDCDNKYSYEVDIRFVDDRGNTIIPRNLTGDYGKITCGRNKKVEWDLFKQLNDFEGNYKAIIKVVNVYSRSGKAITINFGNSSILFSSIIPWAYLGVKYNYSNNYGFYFSANYGFFWDDEYIGVISAGISKSLSKKTVFYLGPSFMIYYDNNFGLESGFLVRKKLTYDIGLTLHYVDDFLPIYPGLRLGIGYSF